MGMYGLGLYGDSGFMVGNVSCFEKMPAPFPKTRFCWAEQSVDGE